MIGGTAAFLQFQQLIRGLRDLGYDVKEDDDFGEFSICGYTCSYRFLGLLEIDFLAPGQCLKGRLEPDLMLTYDGRGWRDVTKEGVLEVCRSNQELFNRCLKRVNYDAAAVLGFSPHMCILAALP
jgi:hypothetical protein